jgi:M6 family metalloprotease-like protein
MKRLMVMMLMVGVLTACGSEEPIPSPEVASPVLEGSVLVVPFDGFEEEFAPYFPGFEIVNSFEESMVEEYETLVVFDDGSLNLSSLDIPESDVLDVSYINNDPQQLYVVNASDPDVLPVMIKSLGNNNFNQASSFTYELQQTGTLFVVEEVNSKVAQELRDYITLDDQIVRRLVMSEVYQYERVVVIEETRSVSSIPGDPLTFELVVSEINYGVQTQKLLLDEYRLNWQETISLLMTNLDAFQGPTRVSYQHNPRYLIGSEQILRNTDICRLPDLANEVDVTTGFPIPSARIPREGAVTAKVIYVDFSDYRLDWSQTQLQDYIASQTEYATDFYEQMSFSRMQLEFDLHPEVISLPGTVDSYRLSTEDRDGKMVDMMFDAIEIADPTVDFSGIDFLVFVVNPQVPYEEANFSPAFPYDETFPFSTDEKDIYNATVLARNIEDWTFPAVLTHEMGHLLGMVDLYDYTFQENYDDIHRFVGGFDIMGFIDGDYHELMGWNRYLLGWYDNADVGCLMDYNLMGFTVEAEIGDANLDSALPMIVIPYSDAQAIVIEAKLDNDYCDGCNGVLIYQIDTSVSSGNGSMIVIPSPTSRNPFYRDGLFNVGQTIIVNNISIEVTEALTDAFLIKIIGN